MSLFDSLERFADDLLKKLSPKEVVKLRSCKNCPYYKRGYCTQTTPPTKVLSEYYAQGCIYYGAEQPVIERMRAPPTTPAYPQVIANLPFKSSLRDHTIKVADNWVAFTPVPTNEVWEVTHINCQHAIVADESAKIDVLDSDANVYRVHMELTTREIEWDGHLWLDEGDYIRVIWDTAGESKVLNVFGVKRYVTLP